MAKPDLCDRSLSPLFSFQGLHLLCQVSLLCEEVQHLETVGLQKVELTVAGSEVGLYGLLQDDLSYSSVLMAQPHVKRHQQTPTTTMFKPPPQKPEGGDPESSGPIAEGDIQAQETPSLAVSQVLEVAIPTLMTPLHLTVGGIKRV